MPGSIFSMNQLARFIYEGQSGDDAQVILGRLSTLIHGGLYDSPAPIVNRVFSREAEFKYIFHDTVLETKLRASFMNHGKGITCERLMTVGMMTGQPIADAKSRPVVDLYLAGMSISRLWQVAQYDANGESNGTGL